MADKTTYFVLKEKAVPEVLLKVVEAKRLLDSGNALPCRRPWMQPESAEVPFYKYKDDIFPFHDNSKGRTITMVIQLDDEPGLLSLVLKTVAEYRANILTIHQSIPVNGIASLTLSVDVLPQTGDISEMDGCDRGDAGDSLCENFSQGVRKTMKVAIMGYGTIGSGVAEVLEVNRDVIAKRCQEPLELKYVLDLRDFAGDPIADKVVHDYRLSRRTRRWRLWWRPWAAWSRPTPS